LTDKSSTKIYGSVYGSPEIAIDSPSVPRFLLNKMGLRFDVGLAVEGTRRVLGLLTAK
jgi:hypothetical protein